MGLWAHGGEGWVCGRPHTDKMRKINICVIIDTISSGVTSGLGGAILD